MWGKLVYHFLFLFFPKIKIKCATLTSYALYLHKHNLPSNKSANKNNLLKKTYSVKQINIYDKLYYQ